MPARQASAGRGRKEEDVEYDRSVGQCRDESGQFAECPPELKREGMSTAEDPRKERIAEKGGSAPHEVRGLQAADEETRERVARAGGTAPHEERGLQAASEETKERVARKGGEASRGGGRRS